MLSIPFRLFRIITILSSLNYIRGLPKRVSLRSCRRSKSYYSNPKMMQSSRNEPKLCTNMEIPKVDDRLYYQFTLSNGIPTTVVQDRTSEKSSCALSVKTGAMHDPMPGVAHITEHAVFLGSEKFPAENAYKDFLNQHGGSSNAGTSMDQTTYKFNINSNAFDDALDMFSQFFKGPLFRTEAMCREIMAVDSEDSKNRIIDSRRLLQVLKHQVDPESDYSKFSTGNLNTLAFGNIEHYGNHLSRTIRNFHEKHYHPSNMAVVLVGPQPVEELKELAEKHFTCISGSPKSASVPDKPLSKNMRGQPLFPNSRGKLIKLRPVKDLRDMTVIWELPPTQNLYRRNPCSLLSYILTNKGEGSWFAALQDLQWATATSSGVRTQFIDFTLLEATVSLTEAGMQHWEEVVALLYQSLDTIRCASDAELQAYWVEMRTINTLDFQYREKNTAYEIAPQLSSNMLDFPPEHIISAGWMMDEEIDISLLRSFLNRMLMENSLTFLRSKTFADGPLNLENDDVHHFTQIACTEFEQHAQSFLTPPALNSLSGECAIDADLEDIKLTGEYFFLLRSHQDAVYRSMSTKSSGEAVHRVEPYYGIPYRIEDLGHGQRPQEEVLANIADAEIFLPKPNKFVCTELAEDTRDSAETMDTIISRPKRSNPPVSLTYHSMPPVAVQGEAQTESGDAVWYSKDQVFRQPRAIFFHLMASSACADGHPVLSMINQVFSQVCARKYYQPAVAGLGYSFSVGARGMGLSFYGYTPRLPEFQAEVVHQVGNSSFWASINPSVILNCKDRLLRTFRSWSKERPDSQCESLMRYLLQEGTWLPMDRLRACEEIDVEYFQERVRNVIKTHSLLSFAHGDCTPETALKCHEEIYKSVKFSNATDSSTKDKFVIERSRLLSPGTHHVIALPAINKEDGNSALLTFFQADVACPATSARLLVLRRLLGEPAFTELRTKRQLGYIVSLSPTGYGRGWNAVRGISVRILSKRFSPLGMEAALNEFLVSQRLILQSGLTDETVKTRCAAIIKSLEDPPTTYSEEASDFWDSLVHGMPFDWTAQVIDELKGLNAKEVLNCADMWLFFPATRRSVSMMIFAPERETERLLLKDRIARGEASAVDIILTTVTATHSSTTVSPLSGEVEVEMKVETALGENAAPIDGRMDNVDSSDSKISYIFSIDDLPTLRDSLPLGPQGRR